MVFTLMEINMGIREEEWVEGVFEVYVCFWELLQKGGLGERIVV